MKQVAAVALQISQSAIPKRGSTSRAASLNVKSAMVEDLLQHPAAMPYLLRLFARFEKIKDRAKRREIIELVEAGARAAKQGPDDQEEPSR